jgi:DNA-binding NtrC family response regulator
MIPVNCGAIPGDLIDSQLFGHMRGAFTGADRQHIGLVRAAAGGTLLLDEVSELPLTAQVRLLRLLEEREVLPVGCAEPKRVDVRIFASTNSDLRAKVEDGSFRKDLFHRLNVIELRIAPLRERVDEIADLFEQFNHEFADLYDQLPVTVSDAAKRVLRLYDWPGNVRELRIVTERLHVLCPDETVTVDHLARCGQLPVRLGATDSGGKAVVQIEMKQDRLLPQRMQHARTEAVRRVLARCGGSVSSAAREIGVHRSTLYRWLASN